MINGPIKKYKNKEKHHIYVETFLEKNMDGGEIFTMNRDELQSAAYRE